MRRSHLRFAGLGEGSAGPRSCSGQVILVVLLVLAGCATPDLMPRYSEADLPSFQRIPGAKAAAVQLRVRDARPCRDLPLVEALQTKANSALAMRGFRSKPDGQLFELSIEHVYRDIQTGFWSVKESAEIHLRCRIGPPEGEARFDRAYIGQSGLQKGQAARTRARELAFADLLDRLLSDPDLWTALRDRA